MVAEIIRALPRDLTMVLIEHDMELALGLVDWVTCLTTARCWPRAPGGHPQQSARAGRLSRKGARRCLRSATCTVSTATRMCCMAFRFEVKAGEVVALLGRNGMGKTTLIRSIMRLAQPQVRDGLTAVEGEELQGSHPAEVRQRRIALVPQGRRLFPSLTCQSI